MNAWITLYSSSLRYHDPSEIPKRQVGLVLGTSRYTSEGESNVFYKARILAAKELYETKKVDCLLLSGDNTTINYNEPIAMQNSLLELGIPPERMYLDYAWVRTLDSIVRASDIFGLKSFVIISQPFHIDRAIFIAKNNGIDAIGYEAESVSFWKAPKIYIREYVSRVMVFYDIFIGTKPRFWGEKVQIITDQNLRPVPKKICTPRDAPTEL